MCSIGFVSRWAAAYLLLFCIGSGRPIRYLMLLCSLTHARYEYLMTSRWDIGRSFSALCFGISLLALSVSLVCVVVAHFGWVLVGLGTHRLGLDWMDWIGTHRHGIRQAIVRLKVG